jgi:ech hydrogenase subunit B
LGVIGLFFLNSSLWSVVVAIVAVAICYFVEILVDNTNARLKWHRMLNNTWIVTAVLGALNLIILEVVKGGLE